MNSYPTLLPMLNTICPGWLAEHRFHPPRRFRFDYAHPGMKIALEVDGGLWVRGRHSRGKGQIADMEKGNLACMDGWYVLHFTPQHVKSGEILTIMRQMVESRK